MSRALWKPPKVFHKRQIHHASFFLFLLPGVLGAGGLVAGGLGSRYQYPYPPLRGVSLPGTSGAVVISGAVVVVGVGVHVSLLAPPMGSMSHPSGWPTGLRGFVGAQGRALFQDGNIGSHQRNGCYVPET